MKPYYYRLVLLDTMVLSKKRNVVPYVSQNFTAVKVRLNSESIQHTGNLAKTLYSRMFPIYTLIEFNRLLNSQCFHTNKPYISKDSHLFVIV